MAEAARKCAPQKAAPHLPKHAAYVPSMVLTKRARLMAAPPAHAVVALHIAGNTAAESERERSIDSTHAPLPRARHLRRMIVLYRLHQILHRVHLIHAYTNKPSAAAVPVCRLVAVVAAVVVAAVVVPLQKSFVQTMSRIIAGLLAK